MTEQSLAEGQCATQQASLGGGLEGEGSPPPEEKK